MRPSTGYVGTYLHTGFASSLVAQVEQAKGWGVARLFGLLGRDDPNPNWIEDDRRTMAWLVEHWKDLESKEPPGSGM